MNIVLKNSILLDWQAVGFSEYKYDLIRMMSVDSNYLNCIQILVNNIELFEEHPFKCKWFVLFTGIYSDIPNIFMNKEYSFSQLNDLKNEIDQYLIKYEKLKMFV